MSEEIKDNGNISDGSHTFNELYYHRMVLFSVICNTYKAQAWKSLKHDDGTMFEDYFIVGISTPKGNFTYHYHIDHYDMFDVKVLAKAPTWDGHTADDVTRLTSLLSLLEKPDCFNAELYPEVVEFVETNLIPGGYCYFCGKPALSFDDDEYNYNFLCVHCCYGLEDTELYISKESIYPTDEEMNILLIDAKAYLEGRE